MLKSTVDKIYPDYTKALKIANLVLKQFLRMNNIQSMIEDSKKKKKKKRN